jgi:hypothetical protein
MADRGFKRCFGKKIWFSIKVIAEIVFTSNTITQGLVI